MSKWGVAPRWATVFRPQGSVYFSVYDLFLGWMTEFIPYVMIFKILVVSILNVFFAGGMNSALHPSPSFSSPARPQRPVRYSIFLCSIFDILHSTSPSAFTSPFSHLTASCFHPRTSARNLCVIKSNDCSNNQNVQIFNK
jgi:hypothetical protein